MNTFFTKTLALATLAFISMAARADGFRCESNDGWKVKLYNQVQPALGTKNPAVLIISTASDGTLAVLQSDAISKAIDNEATGYGGEANGYVDGRFVSASLSVEKAQDEEGNQVGSLIYTANGQSQIVVLSCVHYLKHP